MNEDFVAKFMHFWYLKRTRRLLKLYCAFFWPHAGLQMDQYDSAHTLFTFNSESSLVFCLM